MNYQLYSPSPALSGFIKCYWSLEGEELPGPQQRVFPDGCVELIFHYGDLFTKYHSGKPFLQPRSFIHGQLTRYIEIGGNGKIGIFSVRFYPTGLRPFIRINAGEINDDNICITDIWNAEGRELEDRMANAINNEQRIKIIERFLLKQLEPGSGSLVNRSIALIDQQNGIINIDVLSSRLNIGRRHFERQFIAAVGLSPKQYARIARFQHILSLAEQKRYNSLTDLAYAGDFYDQAHFIRDFRAFTGFSPKQYFAEHLPLVKFFSL